MPPEAAHARTPDGAAPPSSPTAAMLAEQLERYLEQHPAAVVLEDGKLLFELASTQHTVSAQHDRCTLHLWSGDRNLVRTVTEATPRGNTLRLQTQRFGSATPKSLILAPGAERREPRQRDTVRQGYTRLLQRVLAREYPDWQVEAFRASMDLERSFGPAYARGTLVRGKEPGPSSGSGLPKPRVSLRASSRSVSSGFITAVSAVTASASTRASTSLCPGAFPP